MPLLSRRAFADLKRCTRQAIDYAVANNQVVVRRDGKIDSEQASNKAWTPKQRRPPAAKRGKKDRKPKGSEPRPAKAAKPKPQPKPASGPTDAPSGEPPPKEPSGPTYDEVLAQVLADERVRADRATRRMKVLDYRVKAGLLISKAQTIATVRTITLEFRAAVDALAPRLRTAVAHACVCSSCGGGVEVRDVSIEIRHETDRILSELSRRMSELLDGAGTDRTPESSA